MKQDEFGPLPREYPDHPPEQAAPGPEFAEHAPTFPEKPKRNRFALVAAAVLMAFMLMFEVTPAVPADIITPSPTSVTENVPPQESEPAPEPTPEPEPPVPPTCKAVFFAFSDSLRAKLIFANPEEIISVRAELWDSIGQTLEQTWEVPRDAVVLGSYELPDMPGLYDIYMNHHQDYNPSDTFPLPELHVFMTHSDTEGETTEEQIVPYTDEQGWSVRMKDGEVSFRTYEAYAPVALRAGDDSSDPESLESGEIMVVVQINGETVPTDKCHVFQEEDTWSTSDGENVTFHYSCLTTPQEGESGTVVVTVYQRLRGYDMVWFESAVLEY